MNELLRELEDDLRQERIQSFWQRFGKSAVWVSIAIVVGTAAGVTWKHYKQGRNMERTHQLTAAMQALDAGNAKDAITGFDKLGGSASAQYGLAMLKKADAQKASGDDVGAEKTLQQLAGEKGDDLAVFADLAKLKLGSAKGGFGSQSPLYLSLAEAQAWALMAEGKTQEAADAFAFIKDDAKAPPSMRQRVTLALEYAAPEKNNFTAGRQ